MTCNLLLKVVNPIVASTIYFSKQTQSYCIDFVQGKIGQAFFGMEGLFLDIFGFYYRVNLILIALACRNMR